MASGSFEKNSVDWWIQQRQQESGEWLEGLFSGFRLGNLGGEDWALPDWFLQGFFWTVVVAIAAGILWQIYKISQPYIQSYLQREKKRSPLPSEAVPISPSEWLERSRSAQQQGNYREACRSLYMAALQQLGDRIPLEASRTDGEYLRLIGRTNLPQNPPYQLLIHTHERLCFSDTPISAETFERCWQAYQEIVRP